MSPPSEKRRKVAAKCPQCDVIFVAWLWEDGRIGPVGARDPCPCVDPEYIILGDEGEAPSSTE